MHLADYTAKQRSTSCNVNKTGFSNSLLLASLHPMLLLLTTMNIVTGKTLFNHVILQACIYIYPAKLNIFTKERNKNHSTKNYIVVLSDLCNAIEKMSDKIYLS